MTAHSLLTALLYKGPVELAKAGSGYETAEADEATHPSRNFSHFLHYSGPTRFLIASISTRIP